MKLTGLEIRHIGNQLEGDRQTIALPDMKVDNAWKLVAEVEAEHEDGHRVEVYVKRLPARFYKVVVPDMDLTLTTGSGMADLVADITNAIADGMLEVETESS